jgi:Asp-tRNA(Asn)/Glu-tRNA(Gln) amidotransferase A subunit family amidase
MGVFAFEGDTLIETLLGDRPRLFSPQLLRMAERKPPADPLLWVRLQQDRQRVRQDYAVAFETADVLVQPATPFVAPRIDVEETTYIGRCVPYTAAANLVGFPSVALPAGTADGLPLGIQIIAPPGGDGLALRVAHALEQAAPEHRVQIPPLGER